MVTGGRGDLQGPEGLRRQRRQVAVVGKALQQRRHGCECEGVARAQLQQRLLVRVRACSSKWS